MFGKKPKQKKPKIKTRIPYAKELMQYGIQNEVRRFVGAGKKVVPRLIPFVNNKQLDVTESLLAQGINPNAYSAPLTQFVLPQGLVVQANSVKKIPIKTPQDSLFFMHSVRYWALHDSDNKFPPVGQDANIKEFVYFYDKWNERTLFPGRAFSQITLEGTGAAPSAKATPLPTAFNTFDAKTLYNGMTFILPLYPADTGNPTVVDPTGYVQLKIKSMVTPGPPPLVDGTQFTLTDMDDNDYEVTFAGSTPVFWPIPLCPGNEMAQTPYYHFIKVALVANSPKKINIYGGLTNVPAVNDPMSGLPDTQQNFVHIERLYATTLQGINNGYNQVERKRLFPIDATINIEIENIFSEELLVNGYIFGYQIFERRG